MNSARTPFLKSNWYKAFRFDASRENLFSEIDKDKHDELRKKVGLGYSGRDNPNLEPDMDKVIFSLIGLIRSQYLSKGNTTKLMDFAQVIQYFTLDVITALALGRPFGWLEDGGQDKYSYCATVEAAMPAMNFISAVPLLLKMMTIPAIQNLALPSMKDRIGMGAVKGAAHQVIAERFQEQSEKQGRNDMLQSFINHGMTQTEIADESLLQILAGSDTTATILRVLFICVSSNQTIYQKLMKEVDATAIPADKIISHNQALQLPYLNACIKETLRWYPVNTGLTPRMVGPQGDYYQGLYLPPGTQIGTCAWAVYRHNPVYGSDAEFFRPERWLESDAAQLAKMEKDHDLVFMYGPYRCMGERIARIELLKTVFELVRRFRFAVATPFRPLEKEECCGLMIQRGLMMRVEERSDGSL